MAKLSMPKDQIQVLLLEGVHENAIRELELHGYHSIERLARPFEEDELIERIGDVHIIGIRSRTQITARVLESAQRLFSIGCFSIGTNQVDLGAARRRGIPVFNAPYSSTRSVAELVIGEAIMLMRGVFAKSQAVHAGTWPKSAKDSFELRGKTLGIVGYGHIGSQVSVLAEALGMRVRFYDIVRKLALGNAVPVATLEELLAVSDLVTLHVPETEQTRNMIGAAQIAAMKPGAFLINAARGSVVDLEALAAALRAGRLRGAAVDVFPVEPAAEDEALATPLRGLPNVILTPHVGGSTTEAQANIGAEVAQKLWEYSDNGSTIGAVNFPQVALPVSIDCTRFLHVHRNVPGVLRRINEVFSAKSLNIAGQYLQTDSELGFVVFDVQGELDPAALIAELRGIEGTLKVRYLFPGTTAG